MLRRSCGRPTVRYRLHAGENVEHPQAYFLHYIITCAVSELLSAFSELGLSLLSYKLHCLNYS